MRKIFLLLILISVIISSVSAISISRNIRVNETVEAGTALKYPFVFSLDQETRGEFEYILATGSCKDWIKLDKNWTVIEKPTTVNAFINVPNDSTGVYRCDIHFVSPLNDTMRTEINVPVSIRISGTDMNSTQNITEKVQTIVTTIPTMVSTPTKIVVQATPTKEVTSNVSSQPVNEVPRIPAIWYGILAAFAGIAILGYVIFRKLTGSQLEYYEV